MLRMKRGVAKRSSTNSVTMFWFICSVSSDDSAEKALCGIEEIPFENSDLGDARRPQHELRQTELKTAR